MSFRVIPVLDVKAGIAVHAVAGERAHYGPVRSILHADSDPLGLARAFQRTLGLRDLYLADLDAIMGGEPRVALYRALADQGLRTWIDAGVRDAASLPPLLAGSVATVVAGLETLRGPGALEALVAKLGPERLLFSLDLRAGVPITADPAAWGVDGPLAIARRALRLGVRRLLLLDLARVGTGCGTGTRTLLVDLRRLVGEDPVEIVVGGGIASAADVRDLQSAGASAVLIGSALHDGRIGREDLER